MLEFYIISKPTKGFSQKYQIPTCVSCTYCKIATTAPFDTHFPLVAKEPVGHDFTLGIFGTIVPVDLLGVISDVGLLGVVGNVVFPVVFGSVTVGVDLPVVLDTGGVIVGCGSGGLGPFATLDTVLGTTFFVLVIEQV